MPNVAIDSMWFSMACSTLVNELKYSLRRMLSKFGLKDIVVGNNDMSFFKFRSLTFQPPSYSTL